MNNNHEMNDTLNVFEKLVANIIAAFDTNRNITIVRNQHIKESLEEMLKIVRSEAERKRKLAGKAGRKRKPDSELKNPKKALQMRQLREKWGANSKPLETEGEQTE